MFGANEICRLCHRVFVGTCNDCVAFCSAWLAGELVGPALPEHVLLPNPLSRRPAPFGAYKFPQAKSTLHAVVHDHQFFF